MIYFLQAPDGLIKIGHTMNVVQRQRAIEGKIKAPCALLAVRDGGRNEERAAHQMFAESRQYGEWFLPVAAILDFIADPLTRLVPVPAKSVPIGHIRMSVWMPTELHAKLKAMAKAKHNQALMRYIEETLEAHVEKEDRKAKVAA